MKREERPSEQEAVRTTIVGGRPPGSGKTLGPIPRGIEVLVKKAAVDPSFKQTLMEKRAKAASGAGAREQAAGGGVGGPRTADGRPDAAQTAGRRTVPTGRRESPVQARRRRDPRGGRAAAPADVHS